jgi:hypothetical protein
MNSRCEPALSRQNPIRQTLSIASCSGQETVPHAWRSTGVGCSSRQQRPFEARPLYARSCSPAPTGLRADAAIAQIAAENRVSERDYFRLRAFRNRTPSPPPFSSRNSIPAASNAFRIAKLFAAVRESAPPPNSARRIVVRQPEDDRERSSALQRVNVLAAS